MCVCVCLEYAMKLFQAENIQRSFTLMSESWRIGLSVTWYTGRIWNTIYSSKGLSGKAGLSQENKIEIFYEKEILL